MDKASKRLRLLTLAYGDVLAMEEAWLKRHRPYSRIILIGRRLFNVSVYVAITAFTILAAIKLGWIAIIVPMG